MKTSAAPSGQLALAFASESPRAPASSKAVGERRVLVGSAVFTYRLRRARRRTIGFHVDAGGLTVSAPRWVAVREVEQAIAEKRRWIAARLVEWREWRARQPALQPVFADGGRVQVLGEWATLRLRTDGRAELSTASRELSLPAAPTASETEVREQLQFWLQGEARRVLAERVLQFSGRIEGRLRGWTLSSARTQWGSCTHDGRIRLNWRLVHFALPVIDYVIAHELAHLWELNHSARFWRRVGELLPGFEAARDQIRRVDIAMLPV